MRHEPFAKHLSVLGCALGLALGLGACSRDETPSCDGDPTDIVRPDFWTVDTHCKGVVPNYGEVFDDTVVHRFDIVLTSDIHEAMSDDLTQLIQNTVVPADNDLDGMDDPIWVPAEVQYDGHRWTDVGMRWKGHSSLRSAFNSGIKKLSFLLTFDYFEEAHPEIEDQRFYGFKKLIFANGYTDQSFVREKLAGDILRADGIPVYDMAFAEVYLDKGDGPEYMGLYTYMEDPSDEMMDKEFGYYTNSLGDHVVGNLYKPWGNAARWRDPEEVVTVPVDIDVEVESDAGVEVDVSGTVPANAGWWQEDIESHFEKCTNEDTSDWSDVMGVIEKLHKDRDIPEQWRADLEEVFDVPSFLRLLAAGAVMMYWDSYGCMHHNYYIYSNPMDHGRFTWLPWDLGETMSDRQMEICPDLEGVLFDEIVNPTAGSGINTNWPLIQYILGDDVYFEDYKAELKKVIDGPFSTATVLPLLEKYHALIAPYVMEEAYPYTTCEPTSCSGFESSVEDLKAHIEERIASTREALEAAR